ncbi:MAG TPA: hypothetical protein VNF07_01935 [Acidimicrobiales bacterium]|nr:hypothetical protein [Acidimicrobiales bacterium]
MSERTPRERRIATREIAMVWLGDHVGRLVALTLGFTGLLAIAFLAAIGFRPALGALVVVVVGVALITLGGRMRGGGH